MCKDNGTLEQTLRLYREPSKLSRGKVLTEFGDEIRIFSPKKHNEFTWKLSDEYCKKITTYLVHNIFHI
jgi:hypothetical protein